jgi:hypothetical protein
MASQFLQENELDFSRLIQYKAQEKKTGFFLEFSFFWD